MLYSATGVCRLAWLGFRIPQIRNPKSAIRNPKFLPLRVRRSGADARFNCAPTLSAATDTPTRRHPDTPTRRHAFPYLPAGTAIAKTLPGPVSNTNRKVSTVAAVKSPRANPIQMPIAPAPKMNAKR
jgi:hypothetical protein